MESAETTYYRDAELSVTESEVTAGDRTVPTSDIRSVRMVEWGSRKTAGTLFVVCGLVGLPYSFERHFSFIAGPCVVVSGLVVLIGLFLYSRRRYSVHIELEGFEPEVWRGTNRDRALEITEALRRASRTDDTASDPVDRHR